MLIYVLTRIDLEGTSDIFRFTVGVYNDWKIAIEQKEFMNNNCGSSTRVYSLRTMEVNHDFSKD